MIKMKKNIFIFGHYGEKNTGDDAMIYALLSELHKIYPESNFSIISPRKLFVPPQTENRIKIVKPSPINVFKEIMSSYTFIMGGGTQIYDYGMTVERFKSLFQIFLMMILAKIFCEKIYFVNIGVEPFKTTVGKLLSKNICQLADFISVRDNDSYKVLKNIGIKHVKNSFDLAVLLDYQVKLNNNKNNILGLSVLPFYGIYHNVNDLDKLIVDEIADKVSIWLKQDLRNKICLFIFKGKSRADDYEITYMLNKRLKNQKQVEIVHYSPNPFKTLSKIRECNFFIGMRYHSCLFAYLSGIPLMVITYFKKCESLAKEIKLTDDAFITPEEILEGKFEIYLKHLQENPDDFKSKLSIANSRKMSKSGLDMLYLNFKGGL